MTLRAADAPRAGRSRYWLILVVAAIVIVLDQVTKTLALNRLRTVVDGVWVYQPRHIVGTLYLELTFNSGFAFGLGAGVEPIIEAVVVVLVAALVVFGRRAARRSTAVDAAGLGLLLGGALSNLADRTFRHHGGAVIDFINAVQVGNHEYWPVFNLADAAIVVGAITLAVQYFAGLGPAPGVTERREVVPGALDGERVDRAVALATGLTRADVAALIDQGAVRVDGRVVTVRSRRVRTGQTLAVEVPDPDPEAETPAADVEVDVPVVYADDDLLVVDKPAGLVVHPGAGHRHGTLVHGLLARYPDLGELAEPGAAERPGIVHRLDKGTSGLMVVARTAGSLAALRSQLATHEMAREYTTLVVGLVESDEGLIDAPLGRAERDPTKVTVHAAGRPARTRYEVAGRFETPVPATLLTCRLETGRTHQIRVHLAAIGHPVVGDGRYGRERSTSLGGWRPLPADRPFLHARALGLRHPVTGEPMRWESPLPEDLVGVLGRFS